MNEATQGRIRYAIYARVSSDRQDVKNSINAQLSEGKKYVQEKGGILTRIFTDEALSGREDNRPGFLKMIEEATQKESPFDAIVVWEYSRFFRNRVKSALYKEMLRSKSIEVVSITQPKDDSPAGDLAEAIFEAFDAFQSATQGIAIKRGMRQLATLGFWMPNQPPFGYKFKMVEYGGKMRRRLDIDPREKEATEALWDNAKTFNTIIGIARHLNDQGYRTRNGKKFTGTKVHRALKNEAYAGTVAFGWNKEHTEPAIRVTNAHEAYVSQEVFDKINAGLAERAPDVKNPREAGSVHLISSKGLCLLCGGKVRPIKAKSNMYCYYTCKGRSNHGGKICDNPPVPKGTAEWLLMEAIIEDILTEENMRELIAVVRSELEGKSKDQVQQIQKVEKEIAKLDSNQKRLVTALETTKNPPEKILERIEELDAEIAELRQTRKQAEEMVGDSMVITENPEEVIAYACELSKLLSEENVRAVRHLVETFVKRVWFEPEYVTIEYTIPLPDDSPQAGSTKHKIPVRKRVLSSISPSPLLPSIPYSPKLLLLLADGGKPLCRSTKEVLPVSTMKRPVRDSPC